MQSFLNTFLRLRQVRTAFIAAAILLPVAAGLPQTRSALRKQASTLKRAVGKLQPPAIDWATARPEDEGLSSRGLRELALSLRQANTEAFLVVRGDRIVYEWYAGLRNANDRHFTAALAKAVTGSMALLAAADEGYLSLDEPASRAIPEWRGDAARSQITLTHLATHASGLHNVSFVSGARGALSGWQRVYFEDRVGRFEMAIEKVPLLFEPGTRYAYSGVGYYALAYALGRILRDTPHSDVPTLLRDRLMAPLGIPDQSWAISYGRSYAVGDVPLVAIGSGAAYSPRALARIGELVLDRGVRNSEVLLDPALLDRLLQGADSSVGSFPAGKPRPGGGWWRNTDGAWPSLPPDALVGLGNGPQVLLVVPSLDLVAVRLGGALAEQRAEAPAVVDSLLFAPLVQTVSGPGSRQRPSSRVEVR